MYNSKIIFLLLTSLYVSCSMDIQKCQNSDLLKTNNSDGNQKGSTFYSLSNDVCNRMENNTTNMDDMKKYTLIGSTDNNGDTIHYVLFSYFFNVKESKRCNNKLLIYLNKLLYGYYYLGDEGLDFCINNNVLFGYYRSNPSVKTALSFCLSSPTDWFVQYDNNGVPKGDLLVFKRIDDNDTSLELSLNLP